MKICIIGCGNMGTGLACLLAMEEDVERLTLADNNTKLVERALSKVESQGGNVKKIKGVQVDALKQEEVARVAEGVDIVFNGTYPSCNVSIMQACLDAGAHYLDLAAMPFKMPGVPPLNTLEAQFELDDKFKAGGLTAIPSAGVAPGWTDLAARYIIDQLDTVDKVIVRFGDWYDSEEMILALSPPAIFAEFFGPPGYSLCSENGEGKKVDLWRSEEVYEFPDPVGRITLFTVNVHGEIYTLPRFTGKPIKHVEVKGGWQVRKLSIKEMWIRAMAKQMPHHLGSEMINMIELFSSSIKGPWDFKDACDKGIVKDGAVAFSVEVSGTKGGQQVLHTVYNVITLSESLKHLPWASHGVYATVSVLPLELVLMLGRGELTKRGVVAVASLDNYKTILRRANEKGHIQSENIKKLQIL
jgi:saccharopine dehydrogenase-like NADP-dependent oxidoreductase